MTNEELALLAQGGERDKLVELWAQVERFVAQQANRRLALSGGLGGVEFGDLYDAGYLALAAAVDTYDPLAGMSFIGWLAFHLRTAFAEAGGYRSRKQARDPLHRAGSLDVPMGEDEDSATLHRRRWALWENPHRGLPDPAPLFLAIFFRLSPTHWNLCRCCSLLT